MKAVKIAIIVFTLILIIVLMSITLIPKGKNKVEDKVITERAPSNILFSRQKLNYDGRILNYKYDSDGNLIIIIDGVEYYVKDGVVYKKNSDGELIIANDKNSVLASKVIETSDISPLEVMNKKSELEIMAEEQGIDYDLLEEAMKELDMKPEEVLKYLKNSNKTLSDLLNPTPTETVNPNALRDKKDVLDESGIVSSNDTQKVSFVKEIPGLNIQTKTPETSLSPTNSSESIDRAALYNAVASQGQVKSDDQKKLDFISQYKNNSNQYYINDHSIAIGTIITMNLISGVNTDLPGSIIAMVTQNVYDSITGNNLLIPKGTKLFASYNSTIVFGQKRLLVAWTHMIRPDGLAVDLPGFQGIDPQGYSGYNDIVDNHFWEIFFGTALATAMNFGTNLLGSQAKRAGSSITADASVTAAQTAQGVGTQYLSLLVNKQPTLIIRPGREIKLLVNKTLELPIFGGK